MIHLILLLILRVDEEGRTIAHYLAWLGKEDPLMDILSVVPTFLNFQDIYGETPLMYAVRYKHISLLFNKLKAMTMTNLINHVQL